MFVDTSLAFSSYSTPQAITSTADSNLIVDVTGAGSTNAPSMIGSGGLLTALGVDIGQGDGMAIPYVYLTVTTAFTAGATPTLQVSLKAAPDNGSYSPGTYTTIYTGPAYTGTQLVAGLQIIFPVPPRALSGAPGEAIPRFYKLTYTVASGPFGAGAIAGGIVLNPPAGLVNTQYGSNFTAV